MPRRLRLYRPGIPVHIVQRGHNRSACFFTHENYCRYKTALREALWRYGGALHAYCLMTNHVHLLISPAEADSISRIVQHTGRDYVQYINRTYQRSGTLWEGRHKGSLIEADTYLLTCYRYIERNPVAAYLVLSPEEYPWSSYRYNAMGISDSLITEHPLYQQIGSSEGERRARYRDLFQCPPEQNDIAKLRECLSANRILGSEAFRQQVGMFLGQPTGHTKPGRPKRLVAQK